MLTCVPDTLQSLPEEDVSRWALNSCQFSLSHGLTKEGLCCDSKERKQLKNGFESQFSCGKKNFIFSYFDFVLWLRFDLDAVTTITTHNFLFILPHLCIFCYRHNF